MGQSERAMEIEGKEQEERRIIKEFFEWFIQHEYTDINRALNAYYDINDISEN